MINVLPIPRVLDPSHHSLHVVKWAVFEVIERRECQVSCQGTCGIQPSIQEHGGVVEQPHQGALVQIKLPILSSAIGVGARDLSRGYVLLFDASP